MSGILSIFHRIMTHFIITGMFPVPSAVMTPTTAHATPLTAATAVLVVMTSMQNLIKQKNSEDRR
jgi:hypothetical protein